MGYGKVLFFVRICTKSRHTDKDLATTANNANNSTNVTSGNSTTSFHLQPAAVSMVKKSDKNESARYFSVSGSARAASDEPLHAAAERMNSPIPASAWAAADAASAASKHSAQLAFEFQTLTCLEVDSRIEVSSSVWFLVRRLCARRDEFDIDCHQDLKMISRRHNPEGIHETCHKEPHCSCRS